MPDKRLVSWLRIIIILVWAIPTLVEAGSWSSSGGDLLRDESNPWFLDNTPEVHYCIKVAPQEFSLSQETIRTLVSEAFAFWKKEFLEFALPGREPDVWLYFTKFIETECTDNTQITFQFGTLNAEQEAFLGAPKRHVGISVRTEYDYANLRAKGFVYFSPDRGPKSFVGDGMPLDPWSLNDGHLLYLVMLHEVGHIFGIGHQGRSGSLMAVDFVDKLFVAGRAQEVAARKAVPGFFSYRTKSSKAFCKPHFFIDHRAPKYLGLPPTWKCLRIDLDFDHFAAFGKPDASDGEWVPLGSGNFDKKELVDVQDAVRLFLDLELQKVFVPSDLKSNVVLAAKVMFFRRSGLYTIAASGEKRRLFANFLDSTMSVGGVLDNDIISSFETGFVSRDPLE